MPVRIRLQRHGKKGQPFYHIVVADGRAPRDGKFIEKIGSYNPMSHPATIEINIDKAVQWMRNGAQPSDTARNLLSTKGAMMKHHLLRGVDKGAMTLEQAEAKFTKWLSEKEAKVQKIASDKSEAKRNASKQRLADETKVKEAREQAIAAKKAEAEKAAAAASAEAIEEAPVAEEAPAAEPEAAAEEAPAAE